MQKLLSYTASAMVAVVVAALWSKAAYALDVTPVIVQNDPNFNYSMLNISMISQSLVNAHVVDSCPDAVWKRWKLHVSPPEYDPFGWDQQQWVNYLTDYPLRSSTLSLAFFLIGAVALIAVFTWRFVQLCVSCGRCHHACSVGAEDTGFLGDTKHSYLKFWIYLLLTLAAAMVVWGMIALDPELMSTFWRSVDSLLAAMMQANGGLQSVEVAAQAIPPELQGLVDIVYATTSPSQLRPLVQDGICFPLNNEAAIISLLANTSAMQAALKGALLPGAVALGSHLRLSLVASDQRRRQLSVASSSSPSNLLGSLLPALSSGLPLVAAAENTRTGIQSNLQVLQAAMDWVRREFISSPTSPALVALGAALEGVTLDQWDATLGALDAGLQAYDNVRDGELFNSVADIADDIVAGSGPLSSSVVTLTVKTATRLTQAFQAGPQDALEALQTRLQDIDSNVVEVSGWGVELANGTRLLVTDLVELLTTSLHKLVLIANQTGQDPLAPEPVAFSFVKAVLTGSNHASGLSAFAAKLSAAGRSAAKAAQGGPDPAAARSQIANALRPALADLVRPEATLAAALSKYLFFPTSANLALLNLACNNATGPVGLAIAHLSVPLTGVEQLADMARTLQPNVTAMGAAMSGLNTTLPAAYVTLSSLSRGPLAAYIEGLEGLRAMIKQLPSSEQVMQMALGEAQAVSDEILSLTQEAQDAITAAVMSLNKTLAKLQESIINPSSDFVSSHEQPTKDSMQIAYPVWMSVWGLGALLLVLLAVAVGLNWPGGLVAVGLLLLALLLASQAVTSAIAFGMAVLTDACNNVEGAAMAKLGKDLERPQLPTVLSYYLYGVPASKDAMLQAAFGINVTFLRAQLQSANTTLVQRVRGDLGVRGTTLVQVNRLENATASLTAAFDEALQLLTHDKIRPLYEESKSIACCDAGKMAYSQWCSITAAASLAFGALVVALYLLARMDMLEDRPSGCCSCCACVWYRPRRSYLKADLESVTEESKASSDSKKVEWHRPRPQRRQKGRVEYTGQEMGLSAVGSVADSHSLCFSGRTSEASGSADVPPRGPAAVSVQMDSHAASLGPPSSQLSMAK